MEEVVVGGRRYVAAKVAARRMGYHPDYVGQLCREGIVPCQKVGRSWFVQEQLLARHKLATHRRKERDGCEGKAVLRRKDDFSPSRQAIVRAIAEQARPLSESLAAGEEALLPRPIRLSRKQERLRGEERVGQPVSSPTPQQSQPLPDLSPADQMRRPLPPPPTPPKVHRGAPSESFSLLQAGKGERYARILAAGVLALLLMGVGGVLWGLRSQTTCYALTGCTHSLVVDFSSRRD